MHFHREIFDAFDDDFNDDQIFQCVSPARNSAPAALKQPSCESPIKKTTGKVEAALDAKTTQFLIAPRATSARARLKKFSFVKRSSSNSTEDLASSCANKKIRDATPSTSGLQKSTSADLSVLDGLDLDSFDTDNFDLDDSTGDAGVFSSTPSTVNHYRLHDRPSFSLPVITNAETNSISSGSGTSKHPNCTPVSVLETSSNAKLTQSEKNDKGCTVRSRKVKITTNPIVQSKRRIPGPAGLLPKFMPVSSELSKADVSLHKDGSYKTSTEALAESELSFNMEMPSQAFDLLQNACWMAMMKDLSKVDNGKHQHILRNFNISAVLKQARKQKSFSSLKFPMLCVAIHSIQVDRSNVSAVFKDETGSVYGMIHEELMRQFEKQLVPGSVLVLKQVMITKFSSNSMNVNVTPLSLVAVYSENDNGIVERDALNPISWSALLQEANESLSSLTPIRNSNSVPSIKSESLSSPNGFRLASNRDLKSGQCNDQNPSSARPVPQRLSTTTRVATATAGSGSCDGPSVKENTLRNVPGGSGDSSVRSASEMYPRQSPTIAREGPRITDSAPSDPLQKVTGCDLADDPLWTDDDFESMMDWH